MDAYNIAIKVMFKVHNGIYELWNTSYLLPHKIKHILNTKWSELNLGTELDQLYCAKYCHEL